MTKTAPLEGLMVSSASDLRSAMLAIDRNGQGIVFVCDDDRRLRGVLTDGDARRAITQGLPLSTPVLQIIKSSPVFRPVTTHSQTLLSLLSQGELTHIPLVDEELRVVDYAATQHLRRIQIASPDLAGNELAYLANCINTGWVSSTGPYVAQFERMFGEFCGVPHSLAVSNGTVALHLALEALGIGEGDEVIVPDFTFAASVNVVVHAGATPVLVDIDPITWTMDIEATARAVTPRTKAIMPVHLYGQPCDLDPLCDLARSHGLSIVEDCAEALGSTYKGTRVGAFGDAAAFSFFGNKTITTGEGGMVLFKDAGVAARARRLRDHGMSPTRRYWHDEVGYNYRMTNLQAAIGVAQMERVDTFLTRKQQISAIYDKGLSQIGGLELRQPVDWAESVCWLYTALVTDASGIGRDALISKLQLSGIETRPVFYPLHDMPPYQAFTGGQDFPVTTDVSRRGLSLPSAVKLIDDEVESVVRAIQTIARRPRALPVG